MLYLKLDMSQLTSYSCLISHLSTNCSLTSVRNFKNAGMSRTLSEEKVTYEYNFYPCINASQHMLLTNHLFGNFTKNRMLELLRNKKVISELHVS